MKSAGALAEGRAQDAWSSARNLLASNKPDARVLSLAGAAAFQIGDVEQARDLLTDAVKMSPKDPHIQMNLGNVLGQLSDQSGAFAAYQKSHDLAPEYAEPAFNAGVLFADKDEHINAAIWFAKALERDNTHVAASVGLGEAFKNAGNLSESKRVLEALVSSRPEDPIAPHEPGGQRLVRWVMTWPQRRWAARAVKTRSGFGCGAL